MSSVLRLDSIGLLSKYGFNDGEEPDGLIDWMEEHDPDYGYITDEQWHPVLCRLVRTRLLPVLDQAVEVEEIDTIHNPIRAITVDGVNVEQCWYGRQAKPVLTPEWVDVSFADVLATREELR